MPIFEIWDIVKVPFPYTDRPVRQRRPALVIASDGRNTSSPLLWILMITSSENRGWLGDADISDLEMAGLPAPSIIRTAKIATIDNADAEQLGNLPHKDRLAVAATLNKQLSRALDCS